MTGPSAELWRLHVLDGSVGDLGSNEDVQESRGTEKPGDAPQCRLAIEGLLGQLSANLALTQVHADRNQQQPGEEDCWKNKENHDPDVGIINMAANLPVRLAIGWIQVSTARHL